MNKRLTQPWIPNERVDGIIQLEPILLILGGALAAWLGWRVVLRRISSERHDRLREMFNNLGGHLLLFVGFLGAYSLLRYYFFELRGAIRVSSYLGLLTIISGAVVILKTWRIIVLEYLFFGHMRSGVPVLIVNISSLLVSILMGGWIVAEVFEVQLVPLLATSAIFSIILGLALQDTLGNLFAGIALQFDKPYEIGDWIEVNTGSQVIIGQVQEISWRAAVLTALTDESLTIPNRILAQSKISNYSLKTRPIIRSQIFRIDPTSDINLCKSLLLQAASRVTRIRQSPAPMVLITETHESWLPYKLIYFIDDFGSQWMVSDEIITSSVAELQRQGIKLAPAKIRLDSPLA